MKGIIFCIAVVLSFHSIAQTSKEEYEAWKKQQKKEYSDFHKKKVDDYNAWRQKANAEYAQWLKGEWIKIKGHEAEPVPEEPKPPQPKVAPIAPPTDPPAVVPHEEVVPAVPEKEPIPIVPIPEIEKEPESLKLSYYNTGITIHFNAKDRVTLKDIEGNTLSDAWNMLSDGRCDALLKDCLNAKQELSLSDWGFITLVKLTAIKIYGREDNSAKLLEEWLLMQSGYKVRIARTEKGLLYILLPFDEQVFNLSYLDIDAEIFYVMDCTTEESFMVIDKGFDGEQTPTLSLQLPQLATSQCSSRTIVSKKYPSMKATIAENRNLINYLNDYPKVAGDWHIYANASLSQEMKNQLYPVLKTKLSGKSQKEKLNMLLDWIQTGFEYEYDEEQFGGERSLFSDETLYYPYCDCEDRSILLSVLVKDLVGLDVVLLHFPGHLATAVRFTENVDGDYLEIEGKKYIICDPTYIGAPVGVAMPECLDAKVRVFKLN
ncbi:MAG: hypothetical protein MJZ71_05085 [Bacteroidales bacterium]|nr:hypothetical protein [Bacteroidales bacterium]